MDRERLMEIIDSNGRFNLPTVELELLADLLIANGIGDITEWKHRADVAEEALSIAGEHICDNCDIDCNSKNCFAGRMYLIDYFKQQAEERLKENKL